MARGSTLYQFRSQEGTLRDFKDVKRHWMEKLCNKFKKPTGALEIQFMTESFVASRSTKEFLPSHPQSSWVQPLMMRSHRLGVRMRRRMRIRMRIKGWKTMK